MLTARGVTTAPSADTVEVFIDDKPVQVDPGCTVLQVYHRFYYLCVCCVVCIAKMLRYTMSYCWLVIWSVNYVDVSW